MKTKFLFSIESLVTGFEHPRVPVTQGFFLERIEQQERGAYFNRLARVTFFDARINKVAFEVPEPLLETLLLGREDISDSTLHLYARGENTACKIATRYFPRKKIDMAGEYAEALLLARLTEKQIRRIFDKVWKHPELIQPKKRSEEWDGF